MHTHLIVAEAIGDDQVREFVRIVQEYGPAIKESPEFVSSHIDLEDGGRMILVTTVWQWRSSLLAYASSRLYRQIVAATQHLLVGSVVVKVFERMTQRNEADQ